jgi:predicted  nucleic acid-binding Zn-ribbon protein
MTDAADALRQRLAAIRARIGELREHDDGAQRTAERLRALEIDAGLAEGRLRQLET